MKKPQPHTFREAYGVLQRHAQTLRDQSEPNIDDLLTIVTESVSAYQLCKQRIDAVEAALQAALQGVDEAEPGAMDASEAEPPRRTPRRRASAREGDGFEDDLPF